MSYAIVRNEKLTRAEINGKGTHNDRKAKNHSNKDIDPERTHIWIITLRKTNRHIQRNLIGIWKKIIYNVIFAVIV